MPIARADEFRLRFGSREGLLFIFELEAWMEPKEQYERETERRPGEIGTPLGTPPNLVLMTQIEFAWFDVRVPPEAANPADWAFNKVRETFGLRAFAEPQVKPVTRYSFREHRSVEKPGGGWDVSFRPANPD